MLTDEQQQQIRRRSGGREAPLCSERRWWEVGFAITTYGDKAAGSAGSDGRLVRRYSLECYWQDYCGRNYLSGGAEIQVGWSSGTPRG